MAGIHRLGESVGDLQAEHLGIASYTGHANGKTGECAAVGSFGRLKGVGAREFQNVTAAGAVDDGVYGYPAGIGIGDLNGGQAIMFATDVYKLAAEAQFSS